MSNDGKGSISIYGRTFKDENLDTEHNAAGFVSMANNGMHKRKRDKNTIPVDFLHL